MIFEQKNTIEEITAQFEAMEEEVNMITKAMTQFQKSVIQDDQLDELTKQAWKAKAQLMTLKTSLKEMPLIVKIACFEELKDLQQRASIAQERHQKRSTQLDEFQDIGRQLEVKAVVVLQAVQE